MNEASRPHAEERENAPPRPEVTVVIPTRDRWELLSKHGLLSALRQENVDCEVIVVDDGSVDGTVSRLSEIHDSRLRVIRHEQARGMAGARNAGIAVARAEWLAFLDDDDLWSPRKLRVQLDAARLTGADFVYAGAVLVYETGALLAADRVPNAGDLSSLLLEGDVIPAGASNILVRTDLVRGLGGFDEDLPYSADWDLWIRLSLAAQAEACDEILVAHFKHGGNDLFRSRPDVVAEFDRVIKRHAGDVRPGAARHGRRGLAEWLVHEYREAGFSRPRAYLEAMRAQPTLLRAVGTAGHLLQERARRAVASTVRRPSAGASATVGDAVAAPDWLHVYRSGPDQRL